MSGGLSPKSVHLYSSYTGKRTKKIAVEDRNLFEFSLVAGQSTTPLQLASVCWAIRWAIPWEGNSCRLSTDIISALGYPTERELIAVG